MLMYVAILGTCLMSILMILDVRAFGDREQLTAIICLFCFLSTYLVFDFLAFDPKMQDAKRYVSEPMELNITSEFYYVM
jgi:hypothetical protein